jgi:WD40 repeat protein
VLRALCDYLLILVFLFLIIKYVKFISLNMFINVTTLLIRLICFFAVFTLFSASDLKDNTVKQWELETNSCIRTFQGHTSSVSSLAATVDADRLLSGDSSGSVLLWDIATGQQLASVKAHSDRVSCLAVTPDGSSFVSGGRDCSLKLWHFEALQQPVIQFIGHTKLVDACVVSSDGSRLYSSNRPRLGLNDGSIRVWNMTTGQQLARMQSYHYGDGATSLALSGSLLVSGNQRFVKLWDIESMQLLHTLRGHTEQVKSVAVSSVGSKRIVSSDGRYDPLWCAPCEPAGKVHSLRVWDAVSGAQLTVLQESPEAIGNITVSSDGRLAACSSGHGAISVWDLTTLSLSARLETDRSFYPPVVLFV